MDEEILEQIIEDQNGVEFHLATVTNRSNAGLKIQVDGQDSSSTKAYSQMYTCRSLQANDRVVVMKHSGTYIVLGLLSQTPQSRRYLNKLSTSASSSTIASKVNDIIQLLWDLNVAVQQSS